ncbi:MAG: TRAP transporter substrate-binding protein DctP [Proteobacteria bacterium]|nr:TRAP transporter substrate-binding protein DctP [Pseudomonadota bacterium]
MRYLARLVHVLAIIIAIVGLTATSQADEMRIATLAPSGSAWMKILERGAADIEQGTAGRISTKYYPNGVQGDERDVVRKMKLRQLDGAVVTSVGLSMVYNGIRVLELPRMFDSTEEMDYVRAKMWPYFRKKFLDKGFVLGTPGDVGWIHIVSKTRVGNLDDLRKTRIWLWTDDPIQKALFQKLNLNAVPMGVPDVLPSLTSGRINAAYNSPLGAVALQWSSKVRYMSEMRMLYSHGATLFRKDVWLKASKEDRKFISKVLRKQGRRLLKIVRRDNRTAQKQIAQKGVQIIASSPEMIREVDRAARAVWQELVGKVYTQQELDMVLKFRDEYRTQGKQNAPSNKPVQ